MRDKLIGVGWLSVGSRKKYNVSFPYDEEGHCRYIHLFEVQIEHLNIKRHPNIKKVSDFLNSEEGLKFIEEDYGIKVNPDIKACWNCKFEKSKRKCSSCEEKSNHQCIWNIRSNRG